MTKLRTAIAAASDRGYLPAACCQLLSTARALPADADASLFLVCCDVSDEDVREAERFFATRKVNARVLTPNDVAGRIKPIGNRWPRAAYMRLYFDSLFGPEYDRLIYFDSDTRVRAPLGPLLDADLRGNPVGAVHDFIYYLTGNIRRRRRDLFLADDAPYLQSGVMVFDWPATLADGGLERARQFLIDHPERCQEAPDQDALNAVFTGKWTPLDPRWNLHETYLMFGGAHQPYIEHYTSTKPWSRRRPKAWRDAAAWYTGELADTAWSDFVESQTPFDRIKERLSFARFRYAPRLRDACAAYAPFLLTALGKSAVRSEDEELPWTPKSRAHVEAMAEALIEEAAGRRASIRPPESVLGADAP